eukprot:136199-Amphidinium_carterae.2
MDPPFGPHKFNIQQEHPQFVAWKTSSPPPIPQIPQNNKKRAGYARNHFAGIPSSKKEVFSMSSPFIHWFQQEVASLSAVAAELHELISQQTF